MQQSPVMEGIRTGSLEITNLTLSPLGQKLTQSVFPPGVQPVVLDRGRLRTEWNKFEYYKKNR